MAGDTKILLTESEIPTHWVNLMPDLPGDAGAAAQPRHDGARRPGGPHADLPDGTDPAGGVGRARGRDPGRGARDLQAVAPDAAVPGAPVRARARYAGAHLLQVRGHLSRGLAQAQHGGAAGVLQPRGGRAEARDRDRRRPVGIRARIRLPADGHGVRGVHGRLELRPEALPALDDGDVGRDRAPQPVEPTRRPAARRRHTRPARSASRSPRRSRSRRATRGRTTRSARCSTTCCCTRPSWARSASRRWRRRASTRTS